MIQMIGLKKRLLRKGFIVFLIFLAVAGCTPETWQEKEDQLEQTTIIDSFQNDSPYLAHMYQNTDGNRWVNGQGDLPHAVPLDIPLKGEPIWLSAIAVNHEENEDENVLESIWTVVLYNGEIQSFRVRKTLEGMNVYQDDSVSLDRQIKLPAADVSKWTHPVILNNGNLVYIAGNGDVVFWKDKELVRFKVNALLDARLLVDEKDRILVLTGATTLYKHGVLGDEYEAGSMTLFEASGEPKVIRTIEVESNHVIEGLMPIWVDLGKDGQREIIVTVSGHEQGAKIVLYDELGTIVAEGPAVGRGYRWRHQLMAAPFGLNGEMEIADVLTPHIGGVVEFYQWEDQQLNIVAALPGFSTHEIGSRNLDMSVAGDFDQDGQVELLAPNQEKNKIGGIKRIDKGAELAWSLPIDGRLTTNLAAVLFPNDNLAVGVGRQDGYLRIWLK